jgi:hypothetical protein
MKYSNSRLRHFFTVVIILCAALLPGGAGSDSQWRIQNPYASVDWSSHRQYKANFHTHTTMSDGRGRPEQVIDRYSALGYSILSLTDHDTVGPGGDRKHPGKDKTTWPWDTYGRDPENVGMVAVEGNEISRVHHIGSYFNDYGNADVASEEVAVEEIGRRGGLAVLFHPGRYQKSPGWYVDMFRSYPHLVGIEIYNQGDRYPGDRRTWDKILSAVVAERPVWGFSNDDMHDPDRQLGRNWNLLLLPELSIEWVRRAMEEGIFFYVFAPQGHDGAAPPVIQSVTVDSRKGIISIEASGHERIEWISAGTIVHQGDSVDLSKATGIEGYIRAVIYAADGDSLIGTQPFSLH